MNDLLTAARDAIPGRSELLEILARVDAHQRTLTLSTETDLLEEAAAAVLAGKPLPAGLGKRVAELRAGNTAAIIERDALGSIRNRIHQERRDLEVHQVDAALAFLAGQLDEILAAARSAFETLGPVDSAEDAIDGGPDVTAAWRSATTTAARHAELRSAQAILVAAALHPDDNPMRVTMSAPVSVRRLVATFGTVRNFAELYPDLDGFEDPAAVRARGHDDDRAPAWLEGDPVDALRALLVGNVEPWVPALAELIDARDTVLEARRDARRAEMVS